MGGEAFIETKILEYTMIKKPKTSNLLQKGKFVNDNAWVADETYISPFYLFNVINMANGYMVV